MKILVLGHSDSDGRKLADQSNAWPWVVQRRLAENGIEAEIVHRALFAGPTAAEYVERQLRREQPVVVVLATSTYGVVLQLISNTVRERFGERVASVVVSTERAMTWTERRLGTRGSAVLLGPRKVARRLLRPSGVASLEMLIAWYEECFRVLARAENVHTIILGGASYAPALSRLNPRIDEMQDEVHARLKRTAEEHHLDWLLHEELLGGRQAKLTYYLADGVHTDERSQTLVAAAVLPLVLAKRE